MLARWLPLVLAALLLPACGSSDDSTAAPTSTATTAATTAPTSPAVESPDLQRMPPAPAPSRAPPSSASTTHERFLRNVFDDVQALWRREFDSAGVTYRPHAADDIPARGSHSVRKPEC